VVEEQLGHSNLSMTQRYTKMLAELAEAAARPMEVQLRLRACWVTQATVGCLVQPARKTQREASSMKNSAYSCFSQTVSTVKKSADALPSHSGRRSAS
jgi:hypothetical protein